MGDWGRQGLDNQSLVAQAMGRAAGDLDFVISVGDNFYESGLTSVADPQLDTSFTGVYSAESLQVRAGSGCCSVDGCRRAVTDRKMMRQVPWHVVLGNHGELHLRVKCPLFARMRSCWAASCTYVLHADSPSFPGRNADYGELWTNMSTVPQPPECAGHSNPLECGYGPLHQVGGHLPHVPCMCLRAPIGCMHTSSKALEQRHPALHAAGPAAGGARRQVALRALLRPDAGRRRRGHLLHRYQPRRRQLPDGSVGGECRRALAAVGVLKPQTLRTLWCSAPMDGDPPKA